MNTKTHSGDEEHKTPDIAVGGNAKNNTVIVGDGNQVTTVHQHIPRGLLRRFSIQQWVGIGVILLALLAASIFIILQLTPKQKTVMTGEFRIAIASFAEHGSGLPDQIGYTVAESIHSRLSADLTEISAGPQVEIWGTDRTGVIDGATPEIRAQKAAQLAHDIHAYMVIYGVIETGKDQTTITPEFYLDTAGFYEGAEITGQGADTAGQGSQIPGQYGASITLPLANTPKWAYEFDKKMHTEANVISSFARGLSLFAVQDYVGALKIFQGIDTIEDWDDNDGRKTLYALTGSAAGKVGDLDLTEQMLNKSLAIDPQYARPYIGLANVAYMRAWKLMQQSKKPAGIDFKLLQQCDSYLNAARNAAHKPPLAEVETKIHFSQGQCSMLKTLSGHDTSFGQTVNEFEQVIAAYNNGANPRVQELAGESYARLGAIYELTHQNASAQENYQKAADVLRVISTERATHYQQHANSFSGMTPTP